MNSGIGEMRYARQLVDSTYRFLTIRPICKEQLLHNVPPTLSYAHGQKQQAQGADLLYKIFRGDTKLIRSTFEANQFTHTESHEWNLLWSSGSCKSYLYEGLNEF